ncbi:hypothetical protein N658DRAFT_135184 [Parathielavia hyrcaniae]|uniref:Uncharacterized protein n=1 Tax=Parathielavia hyrcaniae TaxID=113614 RepID=A0AAN6Q8Y4_9PEZI|nr:hypothetical protein N658DRAFT_135184 [Parathielavia hyrcaniae]
MAAPKFPIRSLPTTGAPSLVDICLRKALKNISLITSVGNMPFKYTQPLLQAVKTATQLREMELNGDSDDIYDHTAEHWQRLINVRFRLLVKKHNLAPSDPRSWHEVYELYEDLDAQDAAAATELMKQQFSQAQTNTRHSTYISASEAKKVLPGKAGKAKRGFGAPREKRTFMVKAREQVRLEASRFNLRTPTGQLPVATGQIKKAPETLVNEARIRSQPLIRPPSKRIAAASPKSDGGSNGARDGNSDGESDGARTFAKRSASDDGTSGEPPAKKFRTDGKPGASASFAPAPPAPATEGRTIKLPARPPHFFNTPRRSKGLSATPGANRVLRKAPKKTT